MSVTKANAYIEWMVRLHLPSVLRIERECFGEPWTEDDFIREVRRPKVVSMVATVNDSVVGYMLYELHKNRLHVLNLAVDQAFHRQGIGSAMLQKLQGKLSHDRRNRVMMEVADHNLAAQLWLKANDFKAISILTDFFERRDGSKQDAFLFQYRYVPTQEDLQSVDNCHRLKG